jgi:hypothetical protein
MGSDADARDTSNSSLGSMDSAASFRPRILSLLSGTSSEASQALFSQYCQMREQHEWAWQLSSRARSQQNADECVAQ